MPNPILVNIEEWVEKTKADPVAYLERQATEVFLNALGMAEPFSKELFLKGGTLMGVVHQSPRQTADLDFTSSIQPNLNIKKVFRDTIDPALLRAATHLGYPELLLRVQSMEFKPRANAFENADFPALIVRIGYALRGSPQERHLNNLNCPDIIEADISFNEPVGDTQPIKLGTDGSVILIYSLLDLVSEKYRALLQQEVRNRSRRQDVYDIAFLIRHCPVDKEKHKDLLDLMLKKCASRNITPDINSLSNPKIVERARRDWNTLALEIGTLPEFDECFGIIDRFYKNLPWPKTS